MYRTLTGLAHFCTGYLVVRCLATSVLATSSNARSYFTSSFLFLIAMHLVKFDRKTCSNECFLIIQEGLCLCPAVSTEISPNWHKDGRATIVGTRFARSTMKTLKKPVGLDLGDLESTFCLDFSEQIFFGRPQYCAVAQGCQHWTWNLGRK